LATTRTIRDVIGEPETWPNVMSKDHGPWDMIGAQIFAAFCLHDHLAIQTKGFSSGLTFATFKDADADLCERIIAAMWPGRDLLEALAAAV
jgi:hypothetical protein